MANKEITALTSASTLDGTETVHVVQSSNSRKATTKAIVQDNIHGATAKATPVDADTVGLIDSAASNALKKLSWANIKATLKTYFDTLYAAASHNHAGSAITSGEVAIARLPEATAAQFRNNTADKLLSTDQTWSAAAEVTLSDGATISVDMSTFINAVVTLGGNRTLGNPTNMKVGQEGCIRIVQDGTGSRTLSFASYWEFAGGTAPTLTTTASAEDLLFFHVISSTRVFASLAADIS